MFRKITAVLMAIAVCLAGAAYAEDDSDYTTEDIILYRDELVSVKLAGWEIADGHLSTRIEIECTGEQKASIVPNFTEEMYTEMDVFTALPLLKNIGNGQIGYTCVPGETVVFDLTWDAGEEYTRSIFAELFPDAPSSESICPVKGIPAGYHAGFSCIVLPEGEDGSDLYGLFSGENGMDQMLLLNIRIVGDE